MREVRGNRMSMIFQEPMTSLNPVLHRRRPDRRRRCACIEDSTVDAARARAIEMLQRSAFPTPAKRVNDYPHQFSGGMRQRVMIAMALACEPDVLIADEPTTALDVTVQAQIFDLMLVAACTTRHRAILLITHDMGVIAEMTDRVAVMYAGRIVEEGRTVDVLESPLHPYTRGLIGCAPGRRRRQSANRSRRFRAPYLLCSSAVAAARSPIAARGSCRSAAMACPSRPSTPGRRVACCAGSMPMALNGWRSRMPTPDPVRPDPAHPDAAHPDAVSPDVGPDGGRDLGPNLADSRPLLQVEDLKVHFPISGGLFSKTKQWVRAVDGVSFSIARGRTFGIVGESGSGKSTTALAVMRLQPHTAGRMRLGNDDIGEARGEALRRLRRRFQMVFQDPFASLNPRKRAGDAVREALDLMEAGEVAERDARVSRMFELTGLRPEQQMLYPHQFSGGQRQRIVLARALAANPELVVCDEPVSALDVAIQAQILNLMKRLQAELGLTYLFISHDLGVVRHMCDEIAVMYLGLIVEKASRESLFKAPLHPYTLALWSAAPSFDPRSRGRAGRIRLQGDPPSPINVPVGCRFAGRCPFAEARCREEPPPLREVLPGHEVACHRVSSTGEALYTA